MQRWANKNWWKMLLFVFLVRFTVIPLEQGVWIPLALVVAVCLAWLGRRIIARATRRLVGSVWRRLRKRPDITKVNLDEIKWDEFEVLIGDIFKTRGYSVRYTKRTADQGLDVIAEKGKQRIGIQAKKYAGSVGNDAVMAAIAGSKFYQCNRTIVICTSHFTRAANELADSTGVDLWDRTRLESEINWL